MFAGDGDVFHSRILHHFHPFFRIELSWIEEGGEFLIGLHGDLLYLHHPLAIAKLTVNAPMDEYPEAGFFEPLARLQIFLCWRISPVILCTQRESPGRHKDDQSYDLCDPCDL